MDFWIVVTEDRHADVEVVPFTREADALLFAEGEVEDNAFSLDGITAEDRELTNVMRARGWVWYCRYSVEGDCVRVVRRELRETSGQS